MCRAWAVQQAPQSPKTFSYISLSFCRCKYVVGFNRQGAVQGAVQNAFEGAAQFVFGGWCCLGF